MSLNKIDYKAGVTKQSVIVYLGGKRAGCIYKVEGGYQYYPGHIKRSGGSVFKTLRETKQDLEYDGSES